MKEEQSVPDTAWLSRGVAYPLAVGLTLMTLSVRLWLGDRLQDPVLILFTIPIMVCAYAGGTGPGLLATFVALLGTSYYLLPPTHSFSIASSTERWQQLILLVTGTVISLICEALHRSNRLAKANLGLIQAARDELKTALKQAGELRTALDEHAIVAITDAQGRITFVNEKFCAISQYPREELLGQDHRIINSGHHPKEFFRDLWTTIARGRVWHGEIKNRAKDGSFYWVDTTIVPFLNEEGKPRQYIAIRADITERKHVEEQLRRSLNEVNDLKTALDEHAIVAITDPQGRITFANDKFCAISKYSREELLGQDHRIINSGYHPKEFIRELWTTIAQGGVWHGEIKNKAKDGSFYWVDTTIVPFLGEHGKPRQYVAIRADITERKRVEEEVRNLNADLERRVRERTEELALAKERAESANRFKSEFLANMSHELRTPLNGIIGFSEFLVDEKPGKVNPKQKEYLNDVLNNGRHLLQLINDVLDLSKVEAGRMELFPDAFSVRKAIDEVCAVLVPMTHKKHIAIRREVNPAVDAVTLDQQKFKQVLFNLLSNAVKFSNDGGTVEVMVTPREPDHLRLQVRDTGIGIRPEDFEKLFVEFQQLDSGASRRYQGTGLGLALTKKIVDFQKGNISVESQFGKGSTFTVILPRNSPEVEL